MKYLPIILFLSISLNVLGQEFDIFYLSIGSAHYERSASKVPKGYSGLQDVTGARRSARYMYELFSEKGNGQGLIIRSTQDDLVTKEDILKSLDSVLNMAKKAKAKNPLIVFYFCGHGVSEGIAWNSFLVPGDFVEMPSDLKSNPISLNMDKLKEKLLYLGEVTNLIDKEGFQYMCLVDACYEGKKEDFSQLDHVLTDTAIGNLKDIAAVLRFMNEYHEPSPVVFAAPPGEIAKVVLDPLMPEGTRIGPICRKMILASQKLIELKTLSLMDVTMLMADPHFDTFTPKVTTNYEFDEKGSLTLLSEEQ